MSLVDDLASFRGISREEAEAQLKEDWLIEDTESKMVDGKPADPPAPGQVPFETAPLPSTLKEPDSFQTFLMKQQGDVFDRLKDAFTKVPRPVLAGLEGDALVAATEAVMTTDYSNISAEACDVLGQAMASAFTEEMQKTSITRQILLVTPLEPAKMGKRTVVIENGFLLSPPRLSTPEEDYDQLVEDTERKMTAPEDPPPLTRKTLDDARKAIECAPLKETTFFMPCEFPVPDDLKEEEDKKMEVPLE